MLDLAWSELALIGLVAVMVLGPKELPKAMRSMAQFMRKARKLAGEFQGHWNDMLREAELDEVKKTVQAVSTRSIGTEVEKLIDPTGEFKRELTETVASTRREIEGTVSTAQNALAEAKAAAGPTPAAAPAALPAATPASAPAEPAPTSTTAAPPAQAAQ
ncbi:MAG: Sec-independent protein translocase protein TatB [Rhodospirillaceae bacterium]|nr:Sec-independent protein translocase protein TatB [Rhodospirillaceae bacterium]